MMENKNLQQYALKDIWSTLYYSSIILTYSLITYILRMSSINSIQQPKCKCKGLAEQMSQWDLQTLLHQDIFFAIICFQAKPVWLMWCKYSFLLHLYEK